MTGGWRDRSCACRMSALGLVLLAAMSQLVIGWDRSIRDQVSARRGSDPREELNTRGGEASSTKPQAP